VRGSSSAPDNGGRNDKWLQNSTAKAFCAAVVSKPHRCHGNHFWGRAAVRRPVTRGSLDARLGRRTVLCAFFLVIESLGPKCGSSGGHWKEGLFVS
jgi:hypothetical protein